MVARVFLCSYLDILDGYQGVAMQLLGCFGMFARLFAGNSMLLCCSLDVLGRCLPGCCYTVTTMLSLLPGFCRCLLGGC